MPIVGGLDVPLVEVVEGFGTALYYGSLFLGVEGSMV
jgi:hypothetical protein